MALALLMTPKSKAATGAQHQPDNLPSEDKLTSPSAPELTGRWDFSRLFDVEAKPEIVEKAETSAERVHALAENALKMSEGAAPTTATASTTGSEQAAAAQPKEFTPSPMTFEEIRLWLQSFNAGPYALLKYQGDVPYKETRDYVPRIMKYYEQDLSSEYDHLIEAAAKKYGHDPQMIRAIMKTESNFRNDCVSHAGARGLMQVMPIVWKDIKEKYDLDWDYHTQVFDPEKNIEVACAYLAWLRYDFLPRHFAAYDRNPEAPSILVRDHDRGVPDRKTPRLVAKSDTRTPKPDAPELAQANVDVREVVNDADAKATAKTAKDTAAAAEPAPRKGKGSDDENTKSEPAEASASEPKKQAAPKGTATTTKTEKKAAAPDTSKKAATAPEKAAPKTAAKADSKAAGQSKIEISDSRFSNGKVRVTTRGNGKAIAITVNKGGKVTTREKAADKPLPAKKPSIAKASSKAEEESQGG